MISTALDAATHAVDGRFAVRARRLRFVRFDPVVV
jgi:hypothetical protein